MPGKLLLTIGLILGLLLAWIGVQRFYARFARRNPELGPFRGEGGGCGGCSPGGCGKAGEGGGCNSSRPPRR